jgi:AcrR family transcriptional regulator
MSSESLKAGGRREARREERRCAILAIAQRHFQELGYGGTTMSGIAAELGGSKGTLWAYFPSKEELFAAVLDSWIEQYAPMREPRAGEDLRETLVAYCIDFLKIMLTPEVTALYRLVIAEAPRFPELGRIFFDRAPRRRQQMLAHLLDAEIAGGRLVPHDTLTASAQLHHSCLFRLFMHNLWGLDPDLSPDRIAKDAQAAVALFLDGYARRGIGAER